MTVAAALLATSPLRAQTPYHATSGFTVVAGNAVVAGVTAAIHAVALGKPVGRALLGGFTGGALHGMGKALQPNLGLGAVAIGTLGTSMIANAGRGMTPLEEIVLPVGIAKVRWQRESPVRVSVGLWDAGILASRLMQPGVSVDWARSASSGTFVLTTSRLLHGGGFRADGLSSGSVILLYDGAPDLDRVLAHERIHVQQEWSLHEIWGRPIERDLRQRIGLLGRVPDWIEIGGVPTLLLHLERRAIGRSGPFRSWREVEAESFESRRW